MKKNFCKYSIFVLLLFTGIFLEVCLIHRSQTTCYSPAGSYYKAKHVSAVPGKQAPAKTPIDTSGGWYATATTNITSREYYIHYQEKVQVYQSPNRANNLRISYLPGKVSMEPRVDSLKQESWKLNLSTRSVCFNGQESYFPSADVEIETKADTIRFNHKGLFTEEYINNAAGVRQNFIVHQAPAEDIKEVRVRINVSGGLIPVKVNNSEIHFVQREEDNRDNKIIYKDLKAWDARGTLLTSRIEAHGHTLALVVNATRAIFPITIDPISTTISTLLESNQASAQLGVSLFSAGDVNGDGFSDVIVGASLYDNGEADEGAAFVYHGSVSGITTTIQAQLESNQATAAFGAAVSTAGDVNGDGYSDVIVGAYTYDNGEANEGMAFIYHGSASGITTTIQTQLEPNQATAHLGYSVACAGDVNGDGYSDVIAGAYKFDNGQADEGAAFVYHGSSSGITTTVQAQLETNQVNAHMASSVAGAGDVNGDGYSDVIVGSEYYGNGQADEGTAFVYHGSAGGISTTISTQLETNQASAEVDAVAGAGDVNGDGYSDVIIGSPLYDNGQNAEGAALVYHGSAAGITTSVQIRLESNQANALMGYSVAGAGDVNGDGYSDVIVAAESYDNGQAGEGVVFVHHGSSSGITSTIQTQLESNQASAYMGEVAPAGDVNGDGYSDVILGSRLYNNGQADEGVAFVYHGSASGIGTAIATQIESNQASAQLGWFVAPAGDVNGDGYSDVIAGSILFDNGQADEGGAFVFHGSSTGLSTSVTTQLECNQAGAEFGLTVASAGDVNGDGYSDVIVGADSYDNGNSNEGAAFVYHGSAAGITTSVQTQLESNQTSAFLGYVASAGDVNGDGYSDVIVGANFYDNGQNNEGAAFIYHGSSSGITTTIQTQLESNQVSALFGCSVSSAGDVNGDGYSDVMVAADKYDNGLADEGAVFIYHGSAAGITTTIQTQLEGEQASSEFGFCAAPAGDVNGDGYSDVIVGAYTYDNGEADEGAAFVYHGSSSGVTTTIQSQLEANQASAKFGYSVASAGDVNGDGYSDVIAGAYLYDNGEADEGAAFVYHGSSSGVSTTLQTQLESNQASAELGYSLAPAGDVNGDGYSDIIAGALLYDNGSADEGAVFVYLGNNGTSTSKRSNLRLYNSNLTSRIDQSNRASTVFGAGLFSKSFLGRAKGKLVWEAKQQGAAFSSGSVLTNSVSYTSLQAGLTDMGIAGTELKNLVTKPGKETKIRTRVAYDKATAITGQVYGPWIYLPDYQAGRHGMTPTPLPVELILFTAVPVSQKVKVSWQTASEINNDYFLVERSNNGINWQPVAKLAGAGNSSTMQFYTMDDEDPYSGVSYYRLKQTDYDGKYTYSGIAAVQFGSYPQDITLFPNPAVEQLDIFLKDEASNIIVDIYNATGQKVMTHYTPGPPDLKESINISSLPNGVYYITIKTNGDKNPFVSRFVKLPG